MLPVITLENAPPTLRKPVASAHPVVKGRMTTNACLRLNAGDACGPSGERLCALASPFLNGWLL